MSNNTRSNSDEQIVEIDFSKFNVKDVPSLISEQVNHIKELEAKVNTAVAKAKDALTQAETASKKSAERGFFTDYKKEAIEELQKAGVTLSKAVQQNAEAHKLSFEFQKKLADLSKFLFLLGASNIANNRIVVRELELKMKEASEEEISELARQELLSVIRELKEQEDLQHKQDELKAWVIEHDITLKSEIQKNHAQSEEISKQAAIDERHDIELQRQAEKDHEHDTELKAKTEIDLRHDKQIADLEKRIANLHSQTLVAKSALIISVIALATSIFHFFY